MTLRSFLYKAGAIAGDWQAVRRGPAATAKRALRREAYKAWNRPLRRAMRRWL